MIKLSRIARRWWINFCRNIDACPSCFHRGIIVVLPENPLRDGELCEVYCIGCRNPIECNDFRRFVSIRKTIHRSTGKSTGVQLQEHKP